jgi:predicted PurR-regulated permease PerM
MLAMYLSDFAIATEYRQGATTLADIPALNGKFQEELGELIEHFATQKGNTSEGISKLQHYIDSIPSQASQIQEAIGTVLGECRKLFSTSGLSLKNVLAFSAYKSECRTEFILRFPTVAYNDMKQQAKAWEKLFEAYLLQ